MARRFRLRVGSCIVAAMCEVAQTTPSGNLAAVTRSHPPHGDRIHQAIRPLLFLGALLAGLCSVAPDRALGAWTVQRTPVLATAPPSELTGISCVTHSFCVAVGSTDERGQPLAERWNGRVWTVDRGLSAIGAKSLVGVACRVVNFCMAVGNELPSGVFARPFAALWNGRSWRKEEPPVGLSGEQEAALLGVSCSSRTTCVSVGVIKGTGSFVPLVEDWNGSTWTPELGPNPTGDGTLVSVACTSAKACMATGSAGRTDSTSFTPLAARWDGSTWTAESVPPAMPGELTESFDSVSCSSLSSCTAVGDGQVSANPTVSPFETPLFGLVAHWNGAAWTDVTLPAKLELNNPLSSVSCLGSYCAVVGAGEDPLLQGRGGTWTALATPPVRSEIPGYGHGYQLYGVACVAPTECFAVGHTGNPSEVPLVLRETSKTSSRGH